MCRTCGVSEKEFKAAECKCTSPRLEWTPCELPRYRIGDHLYVREEIQAWSSGWLKYVRYAADEKATFLSWPEEWCRDSARPMHMFRHMSRMTLPVIGVRVERLHDIDQAGAIAEGIERISYEQAMSEFGCTPPTDSPYAGHYGWRDYMPENPHAKVPFHHEKAVLSYKSLWESINGAGSWERNPWVAVTTWEKVIHKNIDKL